MYKIFTCVVFYNMAVFFFDKHRYMIVVVIHYNNNKNNNVFGGICKRFYTYNVIVVYVLADLCILLLLCYITTVYKKLQGSTIEL